MRVLADGKTKLTLLTTKPVNPAAPTAVELNAGIDLSCKVTADNYTFTATDSDKITEPALCETVNTSALGRDNFEVGFTLWREYLVGGGVDAVNDTAFAALKNKGTNVWLYERKSDKAATAPWAATDEIAIWVWAITDRLQDAQGGFLKWAVPFEVQSGGQFVTVS